MYLDPATGKPTTDSLVGYRASGVPGTVRGMEYAHDKYGKKPWKDLVDPAIKLASQRLPPLLRTLPKSPQPNNTSAKPLPLPRFQTHLPKRRRLL